MQVHWTVVGTSGPHGLDGGSDGPDRVGVDIQVTSTSAVTLAEVWQAAATVGALPAALLRQAVDGSCRVAGITVTGDHVLGTAPLLDGAVVVVHPVVTQLPGSQPDDRLAVGGGTGVRLVLVAGPDAGRTHALRPGVLTVGRAPGCDVVLADPDVSRHHGSLRVEPDGVTVLDGGSTNGTWVRPGPGLPLTAGHDTDPPRLLLGCDLVLGATTLRVEAGSEPPGPERPQTGHGTAEVPRPPRLRLPERSHEGRLPTPPVLRGPRRVPWLTALLPLAAAGALAAVTGSWLFLLLAALGPVLVAAGAVTERREHRSDSRRGRQEHTDATAEVWASARAAAAELAAARRDALPDAGSVLRRAGTGGSRLWERSPDDDDLLRVRLGTAEHDDAAVLPAPRAAGSAVTAGAAVIVEHHDGTRRLVVADDDILAMDLGRGAAAVVEKAQLEGLARFVVGQLCAAVSPEHLSVVVLLPAPDTAPAWRWLRWVPHARRPAGGMAGGSDGGVDGGASGGAGDRTDDGTDGSSDDVSDPTTAVAVGAAAVRAEMARLVAVVAARRTERLGVTGPVPRFLVVLVEAAALPEGCGVDVLVRAHDVGVHLLAVGRDAAHLPAGLRSVVLPHGETGASVLLRVEGEQPRTAVADRVGAWWTERLARSLAPLRPAARLAPGRPGARSLPANVPLGSLLDLSPESTLRRWDTVGDGLAVPLGVAAGGVLEVDLVRHGPHALVAGTTGSGKSELLRTWVTAMAASVPPERLTFLLVDYKGGAAFGDCARLPHTVQVLTDLDGAATTRVLQSLRAEIRRREHLLVAAGARDLAGYRALGPGAGSELGHRPALPRLVIVVDEFRVLAEDAPDVLGELVAVAATGRSLGVHLILATQRPGGVVSADIRANASLRIALRVREAVESVDVVDRAEAATLPDDRPGRAVVVGGGLDAVVQTALTGEPAVRQRLRVRPWGCAGEPVRSYPTSAVHSGDAVPPGRLRSAGPTPGPQLLAVASVREAARRSRRSQAVPPWSASLPPVIAYPSDPGAPADLQDTGSGPGPALLLACADLPWLQCRAGLLWRPVVDGPVVVVGGTRTGRSGTLATIAESALATGLTVVRIGTGSAADPGADVGARAGELLVDPSDADHVADTVMALLARARSGGSAPAEQPAPGTVVCVDDADALLDPSADPEVAEALGALVREGSRARVWLVLAGGRSLAASRTTAGVRLRLLHRPADPADASLLGVGRRLLPAQMPPGRALAIGWDLGSSGPSSDGTAVEVQVLQVQVQVRIPGAPAVPAVSLGAPVVRRVDPAGLPRALPNHVSSAALPEPRWTALPVGLAGASVAPAYLDATASGLLVVVGPPGSGRSTALALLAEQARRTGARVGDDPVAELNGRRAAAQPAPELAVDEPSGSFVLIVVDDLDHCCAAAVEAVEILLERRYEGLALAVSCTADHLASGFRGVAALARQHGTGILLHPGRTDARDVLGLRGGPRQQSRLPGRGLLVVRGRAQRIQLAVPTVALSG